MCERADVQVTAAVRVDARTGVRERAELVGAAGERRFEFRHLPPGPAKGAVVVCPPICADLAANYRREVVTARALAESGIAVQRFHYLGTGSSEGQPGRVTFESLVDDALATTRRLMSDEEVGHVAFLGTRWGALVAAAAAGAFPGAPLVAWEPTVRAPQFFQEGLRARKVHALKSREESIPADQLMAELRTRGSIEILGYEIHQPLYDSADGVSLDALLGESPRPVFIVQFAQPSQTSALRAELRQLAEALGERGFAVDTASFPISGSWWFPGDNLRTPGALTDATVDWFGGTLRAST